MNHECDVKPICAYGAQTVMVIECVIHMMLLETLGKHFSIWTLQTIRTHTHERTNRRPVHGRRSTKCIRRYESVVPVFIIYRYLGVGGICAPRHSLCGPACGLDPA